jgi:hypothetical protein
VAYDLESQPEYLGVQTERRPGGWEPLSEVAGQDYGSPGMPRIGVITPPNAYPVPVPPAEPAPVPEPEPADAATEVTS